MRWWILSLAGVCLLPAALAAGELEQQLAHLKAVGREGAGNVEAQAAWRQIVQHGADALPTVLAGMDDANSLAANWLRTAVDAIAARAANSGQALPATELEDFILQTKHAPAARRIAYELLAKADPQAPARLLPGMLNDPSPELRRDAVAQALKDAQARLDKGDKPAATSAFRKVLNAARDRDQVDAVAQKLKGLGVDVDLAAHFGFPRQWMLVGPFDNTNGEGFARVYPPEKGVALEVTYPGKKGVTLHWTPHTSTDPYGIVNFNKALGKHMGVVGYAFTVIESSREQSVEFRLGSNNAIQIFVNEKPIFAREEYHHGYEMDQYVGVGTLQPGRNQILIKVCQNEQTDSWAQEWSFQLRICDGIGSAIPVRVALPAAPASPRKGQS